MEITRLRLAEGEGERLVVYRGKGDGGPRGVVLVCPGGGYWGRAAHEAGVVAEWAVGLGLAAAVLEYRVGGEVDGVRGAATLEPGEVNPPPLRDALSAVRVLRERKGELGLSGRVVVLGFSAGGHLAGSLSVHGCHEEATRVDGTVLVYPVVTMVGKFAHAGSREALLGKVRTREVEERFSLEKQVSEKTPRAFLVHGCEDTAVPVENALMYAGALREKGVGVELHVYEKGAHGFGLGDGGDGIGGWTRLAGVWMKGVLG